MEALALLAQGLVVLAAVTVVIAVVLRNRGRASRRADGPSRHVDELGQTLAAAVNSAVSPASLRGGDPIPHVVDLPEGPEATHPVPGPPSQKPAHRSAGSISTPTGPDQPGR
jgi:uncharacterized membrane protein